MALDIIQTVKDNPLLVGGGVIAVLLLTRLGGSSAAPADTRSADNKNNNDYLLAARSIDADVNKTLGTVNAQASVSRAQIAADMFKTSAQLKSELAKNDSNVFIQSFLSSQNASTAKQLSTDSLTATRAQLSTSNEINARQVAGQIHLAQLSADVTNRQTDLAGALGNRSFDLQNKTLDLQDKNLPTILQNNQALAVIAAGSAAQLATISGNTAIQLTTLNTSAARTKADQDARTSKQKNITNGIGSVIKTVGSIFGF